ncbi:MAG: hypothetical protein ACRD2D_08575, partial [Terriglobales bacterium]
MKSQSAGAPAASMRPGSSQHRDGRRDLHRDAHTRTLALEPEVAPPLQRAMHGTGRRPKATINHAIRRELVSPARGTPFCHPARRGPRPHDEATWTGEN